MGQNGFSAVGSLFPDRLLVTGWVLAVLLSMVFSVAQAAQVKAGNEVAR